MHLYLCWARNIRMLHIEKNKVSKCQRGIPVSNSKDRGLVTWFRSTLSSSFVFRLERFRDSLVT